MAEDKKINEKKQRLLALLREMFQLDQPDLDFGLYRIMHAKRGQVEAFLETEFDQLIDKVFADRGARHEEEAKKEYEAARQQAIEFGAPDPDAAPKVQQARARYEVVRLTGGEDAEIYDHLHRFFSRYYDQGDFMSLRRYGKGAAGGAETYAVPYDGSEVVLHWANKDQYYIKTTENFAEFSFDPRKALQKDERGISRSLFDDDASKVGAGGTALKVHFRIVEASEGAHNNVKASDKDERYFILDAEAPLAWDGNELVVRINYRTDPEKTGQKGKWQDKRNEQLVQTVLDALKGLKDGGNALAGLANEYYEVLAREVSKGKDKKQPLLARYVSQYTASNTMDYFIHKDLGGFLRRELDFYLKNEVLKLDDFMGGEDADVQAGLTDARMKAMKEAMEKAQAIRLLSQRLIDFLAQLEDFQKKLWLKKKFVVETHYCITLDRIPEKFYPEIAANERQREEWVRLFAIDEIKGDTTSPAYTAPLTVEFLKANTGLVVDTRCLGEKLAASILEEIDGLDEQCIGVMVQSENYGALRLMEDTLNKSVDCTYIDPPYNTGNDGFKYKDAYQHSSWLALMNMRMQLAKRLSKPTGATFVSIGNEEVASLKLLMDSIYGESKDNNVIHWKKNQKPQNASKTMSESAEYILVYFNDIPIKLVRPMFGTRSDEGGSFKPTPLFTFDGRERRIQTIPKGTPVECDEWNAGKIYGARNKLAYIEVLDEPIIVDGTLQNDVRVRGEWRKTESNGQYQQVVKEQRLFINSNGFPNEKSYRDEDSRNVHTNLWLEAGYNELGKATLDALFGELDLMSYPKPVELCAEILRAIDNKDAVILDFFSGSGTTGHAAISLNKADNGNRKFLLVEVGDHFQSVLLPRMKKVLYSADWEAGRPISRIGLSGAIRYFFLESYEDSLNNLALNPIVEAAAKSNGAAVRRDYLLRYMLDVETQGSQSLLNVAQFRDPTAYQLEIKKPGSDEREKRNVDLVETFNWLIGLHVDKLHAGRRFTATFARVPDPLLPEDANTRLQVETLTEAADGAWWFRPVEGYVRTKPDDDRHRQSVLVLWRTLTDDPEQDAAALEAFLSQQMKFDPTRREDKTLYDIIYINGTHNLPNLGKYGEVRLLEEEFHRRMWAGEEA